MRKILNYSKGALLAVLISTAFSFSVDCVLAKAPPDFEKLLAKGYNELQINNKEKALEIFRKAVVKYPGSGACHVAVGTTLKRLNKIDEAKAEFKSATDVEPGFAEGWYEYGCSLESDKEYEVAANCFDKYLELKPTASKRKTIEDRIRDLRGKQ